MTKEEIIGKYAIIDPRYKSPILTDNPLEAVWEANRIPGRDIQNICGDKQFIKEGDTWKIVH